jgi:hypothetical protein
MKEKQLAFQSFITNPLHYWLLLCLVTLIHEKQISHKTQELNDNSIKAQTTFFNLSYLFTQSSIFSWQSS